MDVISKIDIKNITKTCLLFYNLYYNMKKVFGFFTEKEEIQRTHENNMKNLEYIYQDK